MDLRALKLKAVNEVNEELREEKLYQFKDEVKHLIHQISENNESIEHQHKVNDALRDNLSSLHLKETIDIQL